MSIVHNDCIHIGNIDTAFNYIGAHKYIILSINKIKNMFFQFMSLHLTMRNTNTEIWTQRLDNICHFRQTLYTIINKKDLATSFSFIIDRIPDQVLIISM